MESKWSLFVISIGFLLIASSPLFNNKLISILMGAVIVGIGFIQLRKSKR